MTFYVAAPCQSDALYSVGLYSVGRSGPFVGTSREALAKCLEDYVDEEQGKWPVFVVTVEVRSLPTAARLRYCRVGQHSSTIQKKGA